MLINLTNHPTKNWSDKQSKIAVSEYSQIQDLPFPDINPNASNSDIFSLVEKYFDEIQKILNNFSNQNNAVHIQGEFTFVFALVSLLLNHNIKCVASTTSRNVIEENGKKITEFQFVKFREYLPINK
jgi:hypothetical protein